MKKTPYWEKLNDPRWQRKRLEIMERDGFVCLGCFSDESKLHVHRRYYVKDRDPWEYPGIAYITLCDDCHKVEHSISIDGLSSWEFIADRILHSDINFEPIAGDFLRILKGLEDGGVSKREVAACVLQSLISLYQSKGLEPLCQKDFWSDVGGGEDRA